MRKIVNSFGAAALGLAAICAGGPAMADDIVAQAKAAVTALTSGGGTWEGPLSAPKIEAGKRIAYISCDESLVICHSWGAGVVEAGQKVGWKVTVIDGRGSPDKWLQAFNQAIALKVDGIVTSVDANAMKGKIKEATDRGIVVLAFHGGATPGPVPELGLFANISLDPKAMGKAQADFVIAHSEGKARVVLDTDCEYAMACQKTAGAREELEKCPDCKILTVNNSPLAEGAQREPQFITAWLQKYGFPLYVVGVGDTQVGYEVPALRAGGVEQDQVMLVGADGEPQAYARIRAGDQYQIATVTESALFDAYQSIDEFNRAFHKMPPSGFVAKPFLVVHANVNDQGGDKNVYVPSGGFQEKYLSLWGVK